MLPILGMLMRVSNSRINHLHLRYQKQSTVYSLSLSFILYPTNSCLTNDFGGVEACLHRYRDRYLFARNEQMRVLVVLFCSFTSSSRAGNVIAMSVGPRANNTLGGATVNYEALSRYRWISGGNIASTPCFGAQVKRNMERIDW